MKKPTPTLSKKLSGFHHVNFSIQRYLKKILNHSIKGLIVLLLFLSTSVSGQKVEIINLDIQTTPEGFSFKGTCVASGLNETGFPEHESVDIAAEIKDGASSEYRLLPEFLAIRPPAGAETPYSLGGRYLTKSENEGVNITAITIGGMNPLRPAPPWRHYGGIGEWHKNAPPTIEFEFEGIVPLEYEGKAFRIVATLRHQWGGPYANWPAIGFKHHNAKTGNFGKGKPIITNDNPGDIVIENAECKELKEKLVMYINSREATIQSLSDINKQIKAVNGYQPYNTGYFNEYQNNILGNDPIWNKKNSAILKSGSGGGTVSYLYDKQKWTNQLNKSIELQTINLEKINWEISKISDKIKQLDCNPKREKI